MILLVLENKMKEILFLIFALVKSYSLKTLEDFEVRLKAYQNITGINDQTYVELWDKVLEHGMLGTIYVLL